VQPNGRLGNPQDIRAAAFATARYLCASGGDLSTPHGMALAVFSYNHSFDYVRLVLSVAARYAGIDPASLGINALPSDKQYQHHRKQQRKHHRARATTKKSSTSKPAPKPTTTSSSGSGSTATAPSPSPSPSPTSDGGGGGGGGGVLPPQPSPTQSVVPLPTGGLP
jgi:hypothetical protein